MLPGPSTRRHVIFDGTDKSVSFQDFVRRLENSPDWIDVTAFSVSKDIVHVVPTHLYGEALRYYETLDSDCQQDWSQLRDIMARRFPGAMRSGGLIRRSTTRWEEDGLPTMAEAPPLTSSQLVIPGTAIDEPDEPTVPEHGSRPKRFSLSFSSLKGRLHVPSFPRSPSRTEILPEPYVTVYSMYIQYAHGGTKFQPISTSIQAKVDLSDPQAVEAAKKAPLITIPSNDDSERYLVGFDYAVLLGERCIDFCHKVLAPRKSKVEYLQQSGERAISPTRQLSQAYSITDFIYNHNNPYIPRKKAPSGTYTIQSYLRSRKPESFIASEMEILGGRLTDLDTFGSTS